MELVRGRKGWVSCWNLVTNNLATFLPLAPISYKCSYVHALYAFVQYVCVLMCVFSMCVYVCVRSVCVCRCVWSATNTHGQGSLQFAGGDAEAVQHQVLPHAVNPLSPGGQDGTHKVPTLPLTAGETPNNLQHKKLPSVNQIRTFQIHVPMHESSYF